MKKAVKHINRILKNGFLDEDKNRRKLGFYDFPFESKLSFAPLIHFWKKKLTSTHAGEALLAQEITRRLDRCLDFLAPITDYNHLEEHWDFVELLSTGLMPLAHQKHHIMSLVKPFQVNGFYQSPALQEIMKSAGSTFFLNKDPKVIRHMMILRACSLILNTFYGQEMWLDLPVVFIQRSNDGSEERHFKTFLNVDFLEIKKLKPLKLISSEQMCQLIGNPDDITLWLELIPPANFEFHGVVSVQLQEVTEEEVLSNVKKSLLERDAVISYDNFKNLEQQLKHYFRIPSLQLGLIALDFPPDKHNMYQYNIRHHLLAGEYDNLLESEFAGSIYEECCHQAKVMVIEDLQKLTSPGILEKALLKKDIRSIALIPLLNPSAHVIGILEVCGNAPFQLNSFSVIKLEEIRPLFRTALQRRRQEIDNEIDTIIREYYTSLHPCVEWKFIEKSARLLERIKVEGEKAIAEPIVFNHVFALYGQGDIINSTLSRNKAIQSDLITNLELAAAIVEQASRQLDFPLLHQMEDRIAADIQQLRQKMVTNDEMRILEFLKNSLHPFFEQLKSQHSDLGNSIDDYFSRLDTGLGIIYFHRKAYEDSVCVINETISKLLKQAQKKAQQLIPHYFEQYVTDGVQYDIYVGQSLLHHGKFDKYQLYNLRLWQLIVMCAITRKIHEIRPHLPLPLTTSELILVHSQPLAIRFRMDEKRFDVDGAYNIRYAVLKKRIDKAFIESSGERLTQSGKIAIVYLQESERDEYMGYLQFLRTGGYLKGEIEDLLLEPMQGVHGLKALRFTVNQGELSNSRKRVDWLEF